MNMLGRAIAIAATAFENKTDKGGKPYILHCLHVMNEVAHLGIEAQIAAVLHDLLEDFPKDWTKERLLEEGFNPHTVNLVVLLTHLPSESYDDYIMRLSVSPTTCYIKMADLRHNSEIHRMKGLREKDMLRLGKYHKAYAFLRSIVEGTMLEKT